MIYLSGVRMILEGTTLIPIVGIFTNTEGGGESILSIFYHFKSKHVMFNDSIHL
jgi:hypothetical protein